MGNCLKTQLKVAVDIENPTFFNALNLVNHEYPSGTPNISRDLSFKVKFNDGSRLMVSGNGNFTDSEGNIIGKSVDVNGNVEQDIFFTNGDYNIAVLNLDKLVYVKFPDSVGSGTGYTKHSIEISLEELVNGMSVDAYYLGLAILGFFKDASFDIKKFGRLANLNTFSSPSYLPSVIISKKVNDMLDVMAPNRTSSSLFVVYSAIFEIEKQDGTIISMNDLSPKACSVVFLNGNYQIYTGTRGNVEGATLLYDSSLA